MPPGPRCRKCTPYLLRGPGGMPLALRLSEGLGLAPCCAGRPRRRKRWSARRLQVLEGPEILEMQRRWTQRHCAKPARAARCTRGHRPSKEVLNSSQVSTRQNCILKATKTRFPRCARAGISNSGGVATVVDMRGLTFELRRGQQQNARPARWKMRQPTARAWRFDVGPRLERGVRPQYC